MIGAVSGAQNMTAAASTAGSVVQSADYAVRDTQDAQAVEGAQSGGTLQTLNEQAIAGAVKQAQETQDAKADKKQQDEQDNQKLSEDQVDYITKELNKLMSKINCNLQFTYHKELNTMSVKMLDKKTHEVIKEVPPEKLIKHMIKAKDWLGAFLDKKI